jgi:hypothetical protein
VIKILYNYIEDLRKSVIQTHNPIDMIYCNFLIQIANILEHNDFLTSQLQRLREFLEERGFSAIVAGISEENAVTYL